MTDSSKQHCENKMQGNQITLSRNEYERLAAYRKRVIPYMCPDEAKDWQAFFDLIETRTHSAAPERLCDECNIIEVEERLINAEQDLRDAKEQAKREERERVLKLLEPVETEFEKHFRYAEGKEYEIWGTALNRVRTVMDTLRKINREGDSPP